MVKLSRDKSYLVIKVILWWIKVKIVKELKRSDGLWRFACGDVFNSRYDPTFLNIFRCTEFNYALFRLWRCFWYWIYNLNVSCQNQNHTCLCCWISLTHHVLVAEYLYWPVAPPRPPPKGYALACTVHVKYMRSTHTRGRDTLRPTFREARAQSDPSSTTFLSKKKFNDSAPTTDRALTCWTKSKRRRKCDAVSLELIQCFKDFWLWESHSSYLLVAQYSLFISTYPRPGSLIVSDWR